MCHAHKNDQNIDHYLNIGHFLFNNGIKSIEKDVIQLLITFQHYNTKHSMDEKLITFLL